MAHSFEPANERPGALIHARMCKEFDEALAVSWTLVLAVWSCPNQPPVHTVCRKQVAVCEWRFLEEEDN